MKTHVTFESKEHVGYLTFVAEDPQKPPTLDYDVLAELESHLRAIQAQSDVLSAVIVQSGAPKYFLVGANLQVLRTINQDSIADWITRGHEVFNQLEDLPLPVIAKVTGYALGGGLELALACDFIVSTEQACFGQPETGLGFIPGWGGCRRLPQRIGAAHAKELIFTGKIIPVSEAYRIGLVNFVGTEHALQIYLAETLQKIAHNSRLANRLAKQIVQERLAADRPRNGDAERQASHACLASGDTQQRLSAFFQQREHRTTG